MNDVMMCEGAILFPTGFSDVFYAWQVDGFEYGLDGWRSVEMLG